MAMGTAGTKGYQELAESLRWYLRHTLRQKTEYAVLVVRPVERQDHLHRAEEQEETRGIAGIAGIAPALCLAPLSEQLRPLIRRTDHIEVLEGHGIAIVLHGADAIGARATFRRLRGVLSGVPADRAVLAIGYAASVSGTTHHQVALEQVLRAAWRPRAFGAMPAPASASLAETSSAEACETSAAQALHALQETDAVVGLRRREVVTPTHAPALTAPLTTQHATAPVLFSQRAASNASLRLVREAPPHEEDRETLRTRARELGIPFVQIPQRLPASCARALPVELAHELRAVAIGRSRNMLTVAMENPRDMAAVLRLHTLTGLAIFPVLAEPRELARALRQMTSRRA